ncbi:hypothetical protein SAMN05421805_10459 [Saccharopolyspora antimicrobica]|uniref:Uncharacterized protein n=1 Tax=Saccharopolyspora antimicrobica TaxID=455193 RepID=A0A1I4YAM5_9PSEU|nr:hypothetical protein ATL45_0844 [Saccharopolyspora antimicrobica]SFN35116.1 hypothetical protein SAMN05421805_10459 [Saccharopolyspora antimicrobica]
MRTDPTRFDVPHSSTVDHRALLEGSTAAGRRLGDGLIRHTRHVARTLSEDAWQITDAEGQHTARVTGTVEEAVARAHYQLAAYGGGDVRITGD